MTLVLDASQIADIVRRQDHDPGVSPSTLHYYVQVGILPPAVGRGRSGYTPEHLTRFRLARRLKREGAPLAQIRQRLNAMTPAEVSAALTEPKAATDGTETMTVTLPDGTETDIPYVPVTPEVVVLGEAATRYSNATEALRARPGDTPRTLRFRGGFSLQVPAGTCDDQIARLYTAIEEVLDPAPPDRHRQRERHRQPEQEEQTP
jgi:DNA-binding transcriptional MerR regulator